MKFTESDLQQFKEKGVSPEQIENQLAIFRKGFDHIKLDRSASVGNGIRQIEDSEADMFIKKYDYNANLNRMKFVPASGAATRMFKALFEFESAYNLSGKDPGILENEAYRQVKIFFENLKSFAFYPGLKALLDSSGTDIDALLKENRYNRILDALMRDDGLNYRNLPKGLILFHRYADHCRTSLEEHLVEGAVYAGNSDGKVEIHLTVSPEHLPAFRKVINSTVSEYENMFHISYDISFSIQKAATDTIAVTKENEIFRESDGTILFRPAGHGALIENLNDLDADIIFIKNIDNVVPDNRKEITVRYKKMLAGILIDTCEKINNYIGLLEGRQLTNDLEEEVGRFIQSELCIHLPPKKMNSEDRKKLFLKKLNRPVRVCGMVKNTGEPGGGPFWAYNRDGSVSLQIVETTQIDLKDMLQRTILESSTHFNPVDIVCSTKDYKGNKFDLHKLVDPSTGFISRKSKDGKSIKALELPGLWNGSMSDWNTLFVEVPVSTFNPVKTVNDLIRPEHQ